MGPLRVGMNLRSLQQPLRQALRLASRLGADAVEIDARDELRPDSLSETGLRQLKKLLNDQGLKVCAVSFPTRRGYDVSEDLDRRVEATKRVMSFAYTLGAHVVVNQIGLVSEEAGEAYSQLLASLEDIGRHGQKCGAVLAARTGSESAESLQRLIQKLPEGSLFVDFDPGNLIVNGFSASEALPLLAPYIQHVHACDGVRDLAIGRGLSVPLGRGSVDFPLILATLEEGRYRGYYTVERRESRDPVTELGDAVHYLRNVAAG